MLATKEHIWQSTERMRFNAAHKPRMHTHPAVRTRAIHVWDVSNIRERKTMAAERI